MDRLVTETTTVWPRFEPPASTGPPTVFEVARRYVD